MSPLSSPAFQPFRPRLTLNLGVTGHRHLPAEAEDSLRARIASMLRSIREGVEAVRLGAHQELAADLFSPQEPRFVLLSSLAAGADSLVADEALRLGFELHAVLPLAREEYEKDFDTADARNTFHRLLARAGRVFEISAANPERGHAYADAARVLLNHSDLLLALWDGEPSEFIAGTAATVEQAVARHLPVIHLHPNAAQPTSMLMGAFRRTDLVDALREYLATILLPVESLSVEGDLRFARAALSQKRMATQDWFSRYLFLPGLFLRSEKALVSLLRWRPFRSLAAPEAVDFLSPRPDEGTEGTCGRLFRLFDELSNAYAARYRSGLVWRYLAPVLSIVCLTCALYWRTWFPAWGEAMLSLSTALWFVLQLLFLVTPVLLQYLDRRLMWHRKFFSYRVVGEQLRQTTHLGAVGFIMLRDKESSYASSPRRWTAWYYRALMRHEGVPHAVLDHAALVRWMAWTRDRMVVEQLNYHSGRYGREGSMCRRLVVLGVSMFALSIIFALLRGALTVVGCHPVVLSLVSVCTLWFPSLAVFFAGFCAYACYAKNQQVSLSSRSTLRDICHEMDAFLRAEGYRIPLRKEEARDLPPQPLHFSCAYAIARQINDCCKGELLGWEDLISTKSIKHQ